ncbi:MAG: hypothetical protein IJ039_01175 [Clostridia bacterium]|nr:hypothetical protein [Clostridia bacterium]
MAKNLLIGLGGTGSRIINYVAADLKKKNIRISDGNISCIAIDRNRSDQSDLCETGIGTPIVCIGKDRSIKRYLDIYEKHGVNSWMPMSVQLEHVGMLDGAAQMRTVARLAFYDTVKDAYAMLEFMQAMDKLLEDGDDKINVTIVSSLAGGTGAGILIQVAMLIRNYLSERKAHVSVNGMLILPDIFIRTINQIGRDERECKILRAHAYATVRELNAITRIKTTGYKPSHKIRLDEVGFDSDCRQDGKPVFDYAFFLDVFNDHTPRSIVDYEKIIARMVYAKLFGPADNEGVYLEDAVFSQYQYAEEPMYGICGTAKAEYPVESVIEYCALRATKDELSAGWQKIDQNVKHVIMTDRRKEEEGCEVKRTNPRKEYIRQFDMLSQSREDENRLFYNIRNHVKNEKVTQIDGNDTMSLTDKVDDFLAAFDDVVKARIIEGVSNKDDAAKEIADIIFPVDMSKANEYSTNSIKGLLTKRDEKGQIHFVHPIAIRYLLYKLRNELEEVIRCCIKNLDRELYEVTYKASSIICERTESLVKILEGFFQKLNEVYDEIEYSIDENIKDTENRGENILYICGSKEDKESIYSSLCIKTGNSNTRINDAIANVFYKNLCVKENSDVGNHKQFAIIKEAYEFQRVLTNGYSDAIRSEYSGELDLDLYAAVRKSSDFEYKRENGDAYEDMASRNERHKSAMQDLVCELSTLGRPYLTVAPRADERMLSYKHWGFSPELASACPELGAILAMNTESCQNKAYSKNELNCYMSMYGAAAGEIYKFNELNSNEWGNCYGSYQKLIDGMLKAVNEGTEEALVMTPHLDKTWHTFLPFLSPKMQELADIGFYRSFWLAIAYGMITLNKYGNYQIERKITTKDGIESKINKEVRYNGGAIEEKEVCQLLQSLKTDRAFLSDIKECEEKFKNECQSDVSFDDIEFLNGKVTEESSVTQDNEAAKRIIGGIGTDSDLNALTLIIKYSYAPKCSMDVVNVLVKALEELCKEFVIRKLLDASQSEVESYAFSLCYKIYNACQMPQKDIEAIKHWKTKW